MKAHTLFAVYDSLEPRDPEALRRLFSLMFNVPLADLSIQEYEGMPHLFCKRYEDNAIRDANIQFLESLGGSVVRTSRMVDGQKKPGHYYIPMTAILKLVNPDIYKIQHRYVFLHDCFTQLLLRHLPRDKFVFRGKHLHVQVKQSEAQFLAPLFEHDKLRGCVAPVKDGFTINFDELCKSSFAELNALFVALSGEEKPVRWSNLPITYLYNRMRALLGNSAEFEFKCLVDEAAPEKAVLAFAHMNLQSERMCAYLRMRGVPVFNSGEQVCLGRSEALKLISGLERSQFEDDYQAFDDMQTKIIQKVLKTGKFTCIYVDKHLVLNDISKPNVTLTESFVHALLLSRLTLENVDEVLEMILKEVRLKEILDKFPGNVTVKYTPGGMTMTTTNIGLSQMLSAVSAKVLRDEKGTFAYILDLAKLIARGDEQFYQLVPQEIGALIVAAKAKPVAATQVSSTMHPRRNDDGKGKSTQSTNDKVLKK